MSLRGNNPHFSRATVFHELIPGHHLQGFMSARNKPYRSIFGTPFWSEGNALYWELLMWDLNFAAYSTSGQRDPKDIAANKIGMLFWRMHRCARIIFSLKCSLDPGLWAGAPNANPIPLLAHFNQPMPWRSDQVPGIRFSKSFADASLAGMGQREPMR
jgi:hypothetical protein